MCVIEHHSVLEKELEKKKKKKTYMNTPATTLFLLHVHVHNSLNGNGLENIKWHAAASMA